MRILLTNDDGIRAPGLTALYHELKKLGEVEVVAPSLNQSGVGHSITYLTPLIVQEVFNEDDTHFGWEVVGSPADCVKLAMLEFCKSPPDLIVSGINGGSNAGINVLYSGTVAAAIEGAFFGVNSFALSLEYNEHPHFEKAAQWGCKIIQQLLEIAPSPGHLWNINFPQSGPADPLGVKILPMTAHRYAEVVERRRDPRNRTYYWCYSEKSLVRPEGADPDPHNDVEALAERYITVTPLRFDMTDRSQLDVFQGKSIRMT